MVKENDIHSKFINIGLHTDPLLERQSTHEKTLLVGVALLLFYKKQKTNKKTELHYLSFM